MQQIQEEAFLSVKYEIHLLDKCRFLKPALIQALALQSGQEAAL